MAAAEVKQVTLTLTEVELEELWRILDREVREVHAELRRTDAPAYREGLASEQSVLRALAEKVRALRG
jgi:hypothetical protein